MTPARPYPDSKDYRVDYMATALSTPSVHFDSGTEWDDGHANDFLREPLNRINDEKFPQMRTKYRMNGHFSCWYILFRCLCDVSRNVSLLLLTSDPVPGPLLLLE